MYHGVMLLTNSSITYFSRAGKMDEIKYRCFRALLNSRIKNGFILSTNQRVFLLNPNRRIICLRPTTLSKHQLLISLIIHNCFITIIHHRSFNNVNYRLYDKFIYRIHFFFKFIKMYNSYKFVEALMDS